MSYKLTRNEFFQGEWDEFENSLSFTPREFVKPLWKILLCCLPKFFGEVAEANKQVEALSYVLLNIPHSLVLKDF